MTLLLDFCGCCGRPVAPEEDWCAACLGHISVDAFLAPWDRTYFALHHKPCPFAEHPFDDDGGLAVSA